MGWSGIGWKRSGSDGVGWDEMGRADGVGWDEMGRDGMGWDGWYDGVGQVG